FWFLGLEPGTYSAIGRVSATEGGFGGRLESGDRFGYSLAAIGDLDDDGKVDYAVGAPYSNDGAENSGSVYVLFDGRADPVAVDSALPLEDVFMQPYPNPLASEGSFRVRLARDQHIRIDVFDIAGRRVATIHDGLLRAGSQYEFPVDVGRWPTGTYVYRISGPRTSVSSSFVVAR
ncbi:MAG: T9SS type A sorting domain-containing protein, partial [Rhodothermales bacterium]|nr:T9SS type A sorting domain-containing protein [Rhodothermales bacterium]